MDLITSLPIALVSTILAEWLELTDTAWLDSAICHRATRDSFLDLLRSSMGVYSVPSRIFSSSESSVQSWIVKKGLNVSNASFSGSMDQDLLESIVEHARRRLNDVTFAEIQCSSLVHGLLNEIVCISPYLQTLQLYRCTLEADVWHVFPRIPNLTSLTFCHDQDLCFPKQAIVPGCCPKLQSVTIFGDIIDDSIALALVRLAPPGNILQLSCSLELESDETLIAMARHCPHLRVLSLSDMDDLSEHVLASVAELCPLIQHLEIGYMDTTDDEIAPVLKDLKLQTLLIDSSDFTDVTLDLIIKHQRNTLRTLFLANCEDVFPVGIIRLMLGCTNLRSLSVGGDKNTAELFSYQAFYGAASRLECLLLSGDEIDNESLNHVARHCTRLQRFGLLTRCDFKKGLLNVVRSCKELRLLFVKEPYWRCRKMCKKINPALSVWYMDNSAHEFDIMTMEHVY